MELEADLYLSGDIDHSTLARVFAKISEKYLEELIISFVNRSFSFWMFDSTCMSTKVIVERLRKGIRNKAKLTDKYHILIGYDPPTKMVMILDIKATCHHVSDSQAAQEMLKGKNCNAWVLGDSAYNTYALHRVANACGLNVHFKPDNKGVNDELSAKATNNEFFHKLLYKSLRGVVETVFGGATNAGLILTRSKKVHTRRLDTLMLGLRHNLYANLKNQPQPEPTPYSEEKEIPLEQSLKKMFRSMYANINRY